MRLLSDDPAQAPALSALHLNIEDPIALATRGEVFPAQVQPGVEEEFTYFIAPTFGGRSQGFDRLSLHASVPVHFIELEIDGQHIDVQAAVTDEGFALELPSLVRSEGLLKLSFRATVYQNRTRFNAFFGNSSLGEQVRQFVDEGDASATVSSESISVQLPVNSKLLANLTLSTAVLTPNGDGIGDELQIKFDALKLVALRPIHVQVYDLAGRKVRELSGGAGLAQRYSFTWDGRDESAQIVPPGTYLIRIKIEGDSQSETAQRLLPVAY